MNALAKRLLISEQWVPALAAIYFLALWPFTEGLASRANLLNLLSNALPLLLVATGQTVVLIGGGIDLSAPSIIALASITGGAVMTLDGGLLAGHPWAAGAAVVAMLAVGAAVGGLNGLAVAWLRMPPFIVTLTTMMFFSGLAVWLTQSRSLSGLPETFLYVGRHLPLAAAGVVALLFAVHAVLTRTALGSWLYALGHNPRAAAVSGVPVVGVTVLAYVLGGFCAASASVLYTSRLETASPALGDKILLDVIGATVIGGTSLFGGRGKVVWTVWGVILLCLIDNSLNLINLSHFTIMMVKGAVILLAAGLDTLRCRWREAAGS